MVIPFMYVRAEAGELFALIEPFLVPHRETVQLLPVVAPLGDVLIHQPYEVAVMPGLQDVDNPYRGLHRQETPSLGYSFTRTGSYPASR